MYLKDKFDGLWDKHLGIKGVEAARKHANQDGEQNLDAFIEDGEILPGASFDSRWHDECRQMQC